MKFEPILAGAHKSKICKVLEANYPQLVLDYTNKHGITDELKDMLSIRWLVNSALTEFPLTGAPQNDTIVEAYINKWVLNEDTDNIIHFYNEVVCKFFAPSNDGLRYTQHLVLAKV